MMNQAEKGDSNLQIEYELPEEEDNSLIEARMKELKDKGIDFDLNYKMAFVTLTEIRRARGAILQSIHSDEELAGNRFHERIKKLSQDEINQLCNLVTLATMNCGVLFWTKNLSQVNPKLLELHTHVLEEMRQFTNGIKNIGQYAKYASLQSMATYNSFLTSYWEHGVPTSDNLGEHFVSRGKPHPFLNEISIAKLRQETEGGGAVVVLVASASSGALEAGIFAHYMKTQLGIPTVVDPVFFTSNYADNRRSTANQVVPEKQKVIAIPFDDRIVGTGYSVRQAMHAAIAKYGSKNIITSSQMDSFWSMRSFDD